MRLKRRISKLLLLIFIVSNVIANNLNFSIAATNKTNGIIASKRTTQESSDKVGQATLLNGEKAIIVKYKDSSKKAKEKIKDKLKKRKVKATKEIPNSNYGLLEFSDSENLAEVINEIGQDSNIESIQPNYELELFTNGQEIVSVQNTVYNSEIDIGTDINVQKAWETTKGSNVIVGVLDGDIDINNLELKNRIYQNLNEISGDGLDNDNNGYIDDVYGWDFVNNDNTVYDTSSETHGTEVSGIIAAEQNRRGVSGVAPNVKLLGLKVANGTKGRVWDAVKAIEYAEGLGANIINCSWGTDQYSPVLEAVIKNSSMCFVCAAGNDGEERSVYPASFDLPNVISVGAVNKDLTLASFSNYGDTVDIAAPGVDIYSTQPENRYGYISGTSASAPFVTGVAALVKSCKSELAAGEISNVVMNNVLVKDGLKIVDAGKAINGEGNSEVNEELVSELFGDIPEDIQKVIEKSGKYSELSEKDKSDLCGYFRITDDCISDLDNKGYLLTDSIRISVLVSKYNMSIEEVAKLVPLYEGLGKLESEFSKLQSLLVEQNLSYEYKLQIKSLFKEGYNTKDIFACYIFAKSFDLNIPDIFSNNYESTNDINLSNDGFSSDENTLIMEISLNYNVKISVLIDCIKNSGLDVTEISERLAQEIGHFELSSDDESEASFKANRGQYSYKKNNNETISLNTGSLSLESTDLSLPGRNGLDLNIITRYDSSESNLYKIRSDSNSFGLCEVETYNEKNSLLGSGWSFGFSSVEIEGSSDKYLHLPDGSIYYLREPSNGNLYEICYYNKRQMSFYKLDNTSNEFSYGGYNAKYVLSYNDGRKEYFSSFGKLIGIVDGFGNSIRFKYTSEVVSKGGKETTEYRLNSIVDSVGRTVTFVYENTETGKKVTIRLEDGSTIQYKLKAINGHPSTDIANKGIIDGYIGDYELFEKIDLLGRSTTYKYYIEKCMFNYHCAKERGWHPATFNNGKINYYNLLYEVHYPTGAYTSYKYETDIGNLSVEGLTYYPRISCRKDFENGIEYNKQAYYYSISNYTGYVEEPLQNTYYIIVNSDVNKSNTNLFNNEVKYIFNKKHELEKEEHYTMEKTENGNGQYKMLDKTIEYLAYDAHGNPNIVDTYKYNKNDLTKYIRSIENFKYYSLNGKLKYYWNSQAIRGSNYSPDNDEHRIAYTYSDKLPYLMNSKEYKKDANTTIREDYTLTSDNKSVDSMTISEKIGTGNFVVKAKKGFKYDSYGNVVQELNYLEDNNWSNYITTNYSYDDNVPSRNGKFNGVFLTKKEVLGVKDADGNLVIDKNGDKTGTICEEYKYNYYGQMTDYVDANGNTTKYTYDKTGRVLTTTLPDNQNKPKICAYDDKLNTVTLTDENGNKTRYDYDGLGNLIYEQVYQAATGSFKNVKQYAYDSYFRLDWEKDLEGKAYIDYTYYNNGRLNTKKVMDYSNNNALVYQETYTYDDATSDGYSVVTKVIEGETNSPDIVTKSYINKHGRIEKVEHISYGKPYTQTYKYDYIGNKTEELSVRALMEKWTEAYTARFEYDYAGRVVKQYNVKGDYITTSYDALGRIKSVTDIKGNKASTKYSTTFEYDNLGRLIREKIPFSKSSTGVIYNTVKKHYYDNNGNVIREQISNNKPGSAETFTKTEYKYNSRNLLEMVVTYDKGVAENYTQYYYDNVGNKRRMYTGLSSPLVISGLDVVTAGSDANYSITKYDYNSLNLLSKMTDPLEKSESYNYDLAGRLKNKIDRNGNTTSFTYDAINNITKKEVKDTSNNILGSYTYSYYITGNRAQMTGGGTTVSYVYDDLGMLTRITDSLTGTEKVYMYDYNGNRIRFVLRKGSVTQIDTYYIYDKLDRLITVSEGNKVDQGITTVAEYSYDDNGNRVTLKYPSNGNRTSYTYNLANKLETLTNNVYTVVISMYTYTYYLDGNQESKKEPKILYPVIYVYDDLGRLKSETQGPKIVEYTYDDYNNRKTMKLTLMDAKKITTTNYVYDKNNRLITESGTKAYEYTTTNTYDNNGNQLTTAEVQGSSTSTTINIYDGFNQLTKVNKGTQVYSYTYGGDGLRLTKTVNGVKTTHVWDGQQIVAELNSSGSVNCKYIRGINIIYSESGGTKKFYLFDGHGNVVRLTNTSGYVIKTYNYDEFGVEKSIDPNDSNPFRYCGEYFDKETSTYYLRARYYNPSIGRFISEDSYWGEANDPLSLNLYTYCSNNPINFWDPTGHWQEGDEKYSYSVQALLLQASLDYDFAQTQAERDAAHQRAEGIRATANSGLGWAYDGAKKVTEAAAEEFSWFLGGSKGKNERDALLGIIQMYRPEFSIEQSKTQKNLADGMFVAGMISPSGKGKAAANGVKSWIKHGIYNEMRETLGEKGVAKFVKAMGKGFVSEFGENGIKNLTASPIKKGGKLYCFELKVFGKGMGHYRALGNFDEKTGHIIFTIFENLN